MDMQMRPGFSSRLHWPNELLPAASNTKSQSGPSLVKSSAV